MGAYEIRQFVLSFKEITTVTLEFEAQIRISIKEILFQNQFCKLIGFYIFLDLDDVIHENWEIIDTEIKFHPKMNDGGLTDLNGYDLDAKLARAFP